MVRMRVCQENPICHFHVKIDNLKKKKKKSDLITSTWIIQCFLKKKNFIGRLFSDPRRILS